MPHVRRSSPDRPQPDSEPEEAGPSEAAPRVDPSRVEAAIAAAEARVREAGEDARRRAPRHAPRRGRRIRRLLLALLAAAIIAGVAYYLVRITGTSEVASGDEAAPQTATDEPRAGATDSASAGGLSPADREELEELLGQLEFEPGPVDGVIDRDTTEAIRAFQRSAGLPEDGRPSRDLLTELRSVAELMRQES